MTGTRPQPTVSVALPTRNRPASLRRALSSIRKQSVQPFEVVISDDSDARYRAETREVASEYECRYLEGRRRGLYANRNHVAAACLGTHIRSMDDDNELPIDHFRHVMTAVEEDPVSIWTIGQCRPEFEAQGEGFECPPQLHPRGHSTSPGDLPDTWAINDAATVYPASVFEQGHWFADDFLFGAAYLEFGSRLRWLGYRIRHLRTTYVISHTDFGRSFTNPSTDRASRLFAAMCHSFVYQPSISNRAQTVAQAGWECIAGGRDGVRDVARARRAYRRRTRT